jgi:OOP family OmpA-OmpF porin
MSRKPVFSLIATAVLTAAFAAPATAQDSGWYLTGSLGNAHYSMNLDSQVRDSCLGLCSVEAAGLRGSNTTAYRLGGGYRVNPNLALELDWVDLGHAGSYYRTVSTGVTADINGKYRLDGFQASLVGRWPVVENFALLGKLGIFASRLRYEENGTVDFNPGPYSFHAPKDNSSKATFGLGVEYRLDPHWTVRADWDRYRGIGKRFAPTDSENGRFDNIDSLTVGVSFGF